MNAILPAVERQFKKFKLDDNFVKEIPVSEEERLEFEKLIVLNQPLPEGVYAHKPVSTTQDVESFYRIEKANLSHDEIVELILLKQTGFLKSIKHVLVFIAALPFIFMFLSLITNL